MDLPPLSTPPPGRVFTPPATAATLWRLAHRALDAPTAPVVAEPSAGDGALVDAILKATPAARVLACELAPDLIRALSSRFGDRATVLHADTLALARGAAPPGALATDFGAASPHELHDAGSPVTRTEWADAVIANPPYLRETGNRETFRALRSWNGGAHAPLYRKDTDLHVFFWDIAMRWLRPGGVLAFLTPAYFLDAEAAEPLRQRLLRDGEVLSIGRAGSTAIFPDASVEAAITVWRKGSSAPVAIHRRTTLIDVEGTPRGEVRLPGSGPWWLDSDPSLDALTASSVRLRDLYRIIEGVSTGANTLRERDASMVEDGRPGEGIFVLDAREAAALRHDPAAPQLLRPRLRATDGEPQWILLLRDGALPRMDRGEPPVSPIENHVSRFRAVLERRAEIARNPSRSWYAIAWPRPELDATSLIVTPKWSRGPAFRLAAGDAVPMTDFRVLVPRTPEVATAAPEILKWLLGDTLRSWYRARLKQKGPMTEYYGAALGDVPVPEAIVPSVARSAASPASPPTQVALFDPID